MVKRGLDLRKYAKNTKGWSGRSSYRAGMGLVSVEMRVEYLYGIWYVQKRNFASVGLIFWGFAGLPEGHGSLGQKRKVH